MRILSIQPDLPEKTFGGRKRVFHLTEALVKAGHELHMLVVLQEAEVSSLQNLRAMGVICHPTFFDTQSPVPASSNPFRKLGRKVDAASRFRRASLRAIGNSMPKAAQPHWVAPLRKGLRKLLKQESFDLVIVENEENTLLARDMPRGVPLLVDVQNVLSSMVEREVALQSWPDVFDLYRWSERVQPSKLRRFEKAMLARYDAVIAMSEQEAAHLRQGMSEHLSQRVHVIENGVNLADFHAQQSPPEGVRVVFTGLMSYYPNVDAMLWFLSDIWPKILHSCPNAHLDIVGAWPPPEVHALAARFAKSVHVTGRVEEVQPYFAKANVVVVPLRRGGGTRLKILEAAAMRRPMVSTRIGAEGLHHLQDGEHLLLRDQPQEFAEGVIRLLQDRVLSETLASAAHRVVEEHYQWSLLGEKFEQRVMQTYLRSTTRSLALPSK